MGAEPSVGGVYDHDGGDGYGVGVGPTRGVGEVGGAYGMMYFPCDYTPSGMSLTAAAFNAASSSVIASI